MQPFLENLIPLTNKQSGNRGGHCLRGSEVRYQYQSLNYASTTISTTQENSRFSCFVGRQSFSAHSHPCPYISSRYIRLSVRFRIMLQMKENRTALTVLLGSG